MSNTIEGIVFDIQGFTVQDGPGIRSTVFLKGCPLKCAWCHSPESQQRDSQISWSKLKCIGIDLCGACLKVCTNGAIKASEKFFSDAKKTEMRTPVVNRATCIDCGDCANACPSKALSMCGRMYGVDEVVNIVVKDKKYYEKSGGGVTISGGEPLWQSEFAGELAKKIKEASIDVAIDTSGFVAWEAFQKVIDYTDLFLFDLKHLDSDMHRKLTGVSNEVILKNARKLAKSGAKMQIRIPFIPMFNNSDESISAIGNFCKELGDPVQEVQVLPYHNLGTSKYEKILWQEPIFEANPLSDEAAEHACEILKGMGLPASVH